jgi:hypothetical protein
LSTTIFSRENPSPRYAELERVYRQIHETGLPDRSIAATDLFTGKSLYDHIPRVRDLARSTGARTVLDYGSGKGMLYAKRDFALADGSIVPSVADYWGVEKVTCFDPGVPDFATLPSVPSHGVVCTDVLEHVPEEDIPWMLSELFRLAERFVFANIASFPASKTLPNGWNAHVTVRPPSWWAERIQQAAAGWGGTTYEFQVRERKRGLAGAIRKLSGLGKWKTTAITGGLAKSPAR